MRSKLDNIHDKLNTNFTLLGLFSFLQIYKDGEIKNVKEETKEIKKDIRIIKDILKGKLILYNLKHRKIFYELMKNNK